MLIKSNFLGLLGTGGSSCSPSSGGYAYGTEGKVAKLVVSSSDCTSTPNSPECICESLGTGDCLTCMADTRCKWKRNACVPVSKAISEVKRNEIRLGKNFWKLYSNIPTQFNSKFRVSGWRLQVLWGGRKNPALWSKWLHPRTCKALLWKIWQHDCYIW